MSEAKIMGKKVMKSVDTLTESQPDSVPTYMKIRTLSGKKLYYNQISTYKHNGNLSAFVKDACDWYARMLEHERNKSVQELFDITDEDLSRINEAVLQPSAPNQELLNFVSSNTLDVESIKEKLNERKRNKASKTKKNA